MEDPADEEPEDEELEDEEPDDVELEDVSGTATEDCLGDFGLGLKNCSGHVVAGDAVDVVPAVDTAVFV